MALLPGGVSIQYPSSVKIKMNAELKVVDVTNLIPTMSWANKCPFTPKVALSFRRYGDFKAFIARLREIVIGDMEVSISPGVSYEGSWESYEIALTVFFERVEDAVIVKLFLQ